MALRLARPRCPTPGACRKPAAPERAADRFQAREKAGSHFNIEMQVRRFNTYSPRSTYYLANTLTG